MVALRNFARLHQVLFLNTASIAANLVDQPFDYDGQCLRISLSRKGPLDGDPSQCFETTHVGLMAIDSLPKYQQPTQGHTSRFVKDHEKQGTVESIAGRLRFCLTVEEHVLWSSLAIAKVSSTRKRALQENDSRLSWQEMVKLVIAFGHVMHEYMQEDGIVSVGYGRMKYIDKKWQRVEMSLGEKQHYGYLT